jgi:alcohol dehydrogenase class IV
MNTSFFYPARVLVERNALCKFIKECNFKFSHLFVITGHKSMKDTGILDEIQHLTKKENIDSFIFTGVNTNPTDLEVDKACKLCHEFKADCVLGIGGTSSIDTAKIVAMQATNGGNSWDYINIKNRKAKPITEESLPLITIPTTSGGGSESTPYAVITNSQTKMKKGMRSEKLYPKLVIVDTELLCLMPQQLVAISGFDAFTQALESFTSKNSNIISDYFALKSLELIISNLEKSWESPENNVSREKMALGSLLSGFAIGITDTNLAHAMSHPISAHYGIQHGLAVLLCTFQEIQFNKVVAAEKYSKVASLFNHDEQNKKTQTLIDNLHTWVQKFDIKLNFETYNIPKSAIEKFVLDAMEIGGIQTNPRPVDIKQLEQLYEKAWDGVID